MSYVHTAHLVLKPEFIDRFKARIRRHAQTCLEAEAGCSVFRTFQDRDDPTRFNLDLSKARSIEKTGTLEEVTIMEEETLSIGLGIMVVGLEDLIPERSGGLLVTRGQDGNEEKRGDYRPC